ncbi:hypothetical protein BKA25_002950 [Actinoalloteichus hymeniacidonis]|uniref:Uncharacterized protein n=1 Tax=Actinoalloteichus hymeniacidonis TaxID=340345 RepID=A0AAC9HPQ5_9PSEU|nr:hypothetical protein TL08_12565 [Actinoalloteichus hymeniacidonis]MBB5908634.1 hypothetical protein [Actinoalloteichus hymeniacidonis]
MHQQSRPGIRQVDGGDARMRARAFDNPRVGGDGPSVGPIGR